MNERREKSIVQLLPPGVCLLEKFALKWLYLHAKEAVDNFGIHLLIQVLFPEKGF